jgi:hypothetical protein
MIASALSVYGKVTEGQSKALAAKALGVPKTKEASHDHSTNKDAEATIGKAEQTAESSSGRNSVAESVLDSFDQTAQQKR